MNYTTHTAAMVCFRKKQGMTQSDVARAMNLTQSAVARLEKSLRCDANVTLSVLARYATAIGLSVQWTLIPVKPRYGIFECAEDAVAFAVHSSACEGLVTPQREIENLKTVASGELSGQKLIEQYIAEALAKKESDSV